MKRFLLLQVFLSLAVGCSPKLNIQESHSCKYLRFNRILEFDSNSKAFVSVTNYQLGMLTSTIYLNQCKKHGNNLTLNGLTSIGGISLRTEGDSGIYLLSCSKDSSQRYRVKDTLAISGINGNFVTEIKAEDNLFILPFDGKGGYYESYKVVK